MASSSFDSRDEHIGLTAGQIAEDADIDVALLKLGQQVVSKQKEETFTQAWRNHWRAAVWSMVLGTALIMEGLDTGMVRPIALLQLGQWEELTKPQLNSFFGVTVFKERFGVLTKGKWAVPAKDQTGLGDTATCGQLVGLVVTGLCQERFGSKRTFIGGMILMTATIFVAVFAQNISMLYAAEFLMGIPWGMFQTLTTAYATGECYRPQLRVPTGGREEGEGGSIGMRVVLSLSEIRVVPPRSAPLPLCLRVPILGSGQIPRRWDSTSLSLVHVGLGMEASLLSVLDFPGPAPHRGHLRPRE